MPKNTAKLGILIPAFNEEKTIKQVISSISTIPEIQHKVIVIDDGSKDNTLIFSQEQGAEVISNNKHMGLGATFKLGLSYVLENKFDIIAILDADAQYESSRLKDLIHAIISEEYDMVIGNRFINGGRFEIGIIKRLGNLIMSMIISKIILRLDVIYDIQSSFRAFNYKLANFISKKIEAKYNYAQEMFIIASLNQFKIKQIPIICKKRFSGKSKLIKNPIFHTVRVLWICFKTYVKNFSKSR
ncbi:MAG: glycosyltransferase family 2 protein [Candidatus Lokiarchaeota archaeon]|jgi:glycosyltransferase involved in cell wall biosynthesis